jgi:glycine oxidase
MGERTGRTVVVGGGIIGLACAWRLAERGHPVTVVDPAPTSGASHVAAGMLAPVTEAHFGEESLLALNLESARRWPAFAAALARASGQPVDFEEGGTLAVALDNDDRAALDHLAAYLDRLGLPAERLRPRAARSLEPMLAPTLRGALVASGDHRVDPRSVTGALLATCGRLGVDVVEAQVEAIVADGDRRSVSGVRLAGGQVMPASTVVLAAGAASVLVGVPTPADRPPTRPVKGQIITVRCPAGEAPLLQRAVRGLVQGADIYLVPRPDGRIVIGATVEERGWDARPTAGGVYELLRDATLLVPGLSECEVVETLVGFRPGTPDNAPIIGRSATPGLVHATGHHRNGVLLTPITADAVAALVAGDEVLSVVGAFGNDRFAGPTDQVPAGAAPGTQR